MIMFTLSSANEAYSLLPSDCDGPFLQPVRLTISPISVLILPITLVYMSFHADWTTPSNSTFGNFLSLPVSTFNSSISAEFLKAVQPQC